MSYRDAAQLSEAAKIAKAAEASALARSIGQAVTVSMDIEQLIYEAGRCMTPPHCLTCCHGE